MRELREVFLRPFHAAVRDAGAISVMPSYNEVDGVPSHAEPMAACATCFGANGASTGSPSPTTTRYGNWGYRARHARPLPRSRHEGSRVRSPCARRERRGAGA
jgi:hypothetical protein